MYKENWTFADSLEMDKRRSWAKDFYKKILDEEDYLIFCSDEASFLDLYVGPLQEGRKLIYGEYNVYLSDEDMQMPFRKLLDILYKKS